jgi:hypothetical protein
MQRIESRSVRAEQATRSSSYEDGARIWPVPSEQVSTTTAGSQLEVLFVVLDEVNTVYVRARTSASLRRARTDAR